MDIKELEAELARMEAVSPVESELDPSLRFNVLLADDDSTDQFFIKQALERSSLFGQITQVYDGAEVINYLKGEGQFTDRKKFPLPTLLLLDLQMPRVDGFDVLRWLRGRNFPGLRVVVLTFAEHAAVIERAMAMGADYYQVKSFDPVKMYLLVRRLELLMVLLYRREPKKMTNTPSPDKDKGMTPYTMLQLVDGRLPDWEQAMQAAANGRHNFILILKDESDLEKLWATLGTTSVMPERIHRWGILAMAEALSTEDYTHLLEIHRKSAVYLIEQLTLNRNTPPNTKNYMLYCELRGIISDHHTIEDAGISLLSYLDFFKRAYLMPLAGIYEYAEAKWTRVKKLTSG
jgi:CheY-like chemotaxis protein